MGIPHNPFMPGRKNNGSSPLLFSTVENGCGDLPITFLTLLPVIGRRTMLLSAAPGTIGGQKVQESACEASSRRRASAPPCVPVAGACRRTSPPREATEPTSRRTVEPLSRRLFIPVRGKLISSTKLAFRRRRHATSSQETRPGGPRKGRRLAPLSTHGRRNEISFRPGVIRRRRNVPVWHDCAAK